MMMKIIRSLAGKDMSYKERRLPGKWYKYDSLIQTADTVVVVQVL